jgi:hypothetical protein
MRDLPERLHIPLQLCTPKRVHEVGLRGQAM